MQQFPIELSIIIPTYNEAENIPHLISRISSTLSGSVVFEIIVIDDHSTDNTRGIVTTLKEKFPIQLFMKKGKPGKAYSLLEGFSYAKGESFCIIDADLQYPPEAITQMHRKILDNKADIVVANRTEYQAGHLRKLFSRVFSLFFVRFLHHLSVDAQSGLKVFRKETIQRYKIDPSAWTFDLEFLLKAREAGYKIVTVPIRFYERTAGKTKVALLKTTFEIGWSAIIMRFRNFGVIPFLPEVERNEGRGFHYQGKKLLTHTNLSFRNTALLRLSSWQKGGISIFLLLLIVSFILNWHFTLVLLLSSLTIFYFSDLLFQMFLVFRSFISRPEIVISDEKLKSLSDESLPEYVILSPMYKEWEVLPQFIDAIQKLEYPKDKLHAVLLLEEDDKETIEKVKNFDLPSYFQILVVPDAQPKTKPKALNYALGKVQGEYAVIYDAEDIPDPLQLKKVVVAFQQEKKNVVCIQAKLNFYNPTQNILTRLFSAEYSLWFDLILPGLQSINAPIPLGGTSNHFRIADLKKLRGWDPFNVTEDADLGMRLFKHGYKTAVLDSTTMEEANSEFMNWFKQRSRWIKGYMQTYLVHLRGSQHFIRDFPNPHWFTFHLIIGGKIFSLLINPLMWLITISYFVFRAQTGEFIDSLFPRVIFYIAVFSLFAGNFLYTYYYMMGALKRKQWTLVLVCFLVPIYWLMISSAAVLALFELFYKPYHWHKTKHGLHMPQKETFAGFPKSIITPLKPSL